MTRSTAGLGLDPLRWLGQVAGEHVGPVFCVAAAVAASPDPATGLYGAPSVRLAQLARVDARNGLWLHLRTLVGTGYLERVRAGGGRSRPSLFELAQPALVSAYESTRPGRAVSAIAPVEDGRFSPLAEPDSTRPGRAVSAIAPVEDGRFSEPVLIPVGVKVKVTPSPQEAAIAGDVVARLPLAFHAHSPKGRAAVLEVIGRLVVAGWRPADIVTVASERLPSGEIDAPWALLDYRFRDRPVPIPAARVGTPIPERWRAEVGVPDPERIKAGAASLRAAMRGAS